MMSRVRAPSSTRVTIADNSSSGRAPKGVGARAFTVEYRPGDALLIDGETPVPQVEASQAGTRSVGEILSHRLPLQCLLGRSAGLAARVVPQIGGVRFLIVGFQFLGVKVVYGDDTCNEHLHIPQLLRFAFCDRARLDRIREPIDAMIALHRAGANGALELLFRIL